jgi:hypothetical protein
MITVKQLREILDQLEPERVIILSKDSEGNNFSPLNNLSPEQYVPVNTWSGWLLMDGETGELAKPAIVLWPTN